MCCGEGTIVLALCVVTLHTVYGQLGSSCKTPNGESATCKSIYNCQPLLDVVQTKNEEQLRFLRESQCGYDKKPLVCCGSKNNFDLIPNRSSCGFQSVDRIFGGEETDLQEFPWMALLEYTNSVKRQFSCGGAVISKRYILTAAHCITGEITSKVGKLVNVRLGEWDTRQAVDCVKVQKIQFCNEAPENFDIEQTLVHPAYNFRSPHRYGDIALIRVSRDIKFTNYIKPICLPLPSETSAVGEKLYVAGWGKTEFANMNPTKLKLAVAIAERSNCESKFRLANINLNDTQICAGGQKGKDSCTGDSGGPLMRGTKTDDSQWYIEGIVSFGAKCGTEGWPGIYTKVSKYLDWIKESVRY